MTHLLGAVRKLLGLRMPRRGQFSRKRGYTVQAVAAPLSSILLASGRVRDGGRSQNVTLYLGLPVLGVPVSFQTHQL